MSSEIPLFGNSNPNTNNKQPKKIILTVVSIAVIILILVVAIKLASSPSSNGSDGRKISNKLEEKLNESFVVDNDIKNASNSKILAVSDQYLFYSDNNGLYRVNKDGSNKFELDTGKISNINVYKGELYYARTDITDDTKTNRNAKHQIVKMAFNGDNKKEIHSYECQRVSSMLVVNDVVLYQPIVFIPDGKTNDRGEATGSFETNYIITSIDGKDVAKLTNDNYHSKFILQYPYNQSELDSFLSIDYPDTIVKTSKYFINDTLYFDTQSIEQPRTIRIFSISKANDVLNLISEHTPNTESETPVNSYLNGFVYDGESIYYILTVRRGTQEKYDLYKIDVNTNNTLFVETLYNSEGI